MCVMTIVYTTVKKENHFGHIMPHKYVELFFASFLFQAGLEILLHNESHISHTRTSSYL